MATMSILGMYNIYPQLFDNYAVPSGMDKNVIVQNILAECAEFEALYPNPVVFANLIGYWSQAELPVWQRMWDAMQLEYKPLENYNRTEEWNTDTSQNITAEGNADTTENRSVSAFNASDFQNAGKTVTSQNGDNSSNATGKESRTGKAYGNIGVTTSQTMLSQELDVAKKGNMYRLLIESFKERFCLLVY